MSGADGESHYHHEGESSSGGGNHAPSRSENWEGPHNERFESGKSNSSASNQGTSPFATPSDYHLSGPFTSSPAEVAQIAAYIEKITTQAPQVAGCGSGWSEAITPNLFPIACAKHDVGYDTLGKPKLQTDLEFLQNMVSEVPTSPLDWTPATLPDLTVRVLYFEAVVLFGGPAYLDAQKAAAQRMDLICRPQDTLP